jgi:hypothetical protein
MTVLNLPDAESRDSLLLELTPFVLYTAGLGPDYRVLRMTDNVERLTGFAARQFIDTPDLWASRLHPDDCEMTLKSIEQLSSSFPKSLEYRWRCADGEYRWFLDTLNFLRDERGEPVELNGCWFDITKRKSLEESMRKLSSIVESSDDAIMSFTLQGAIQSWNASAERIYGYTASEVIGQSIYQLLSAGQRSEFDAILAAVQRGIGVRHQESVHQTKDGNVVDVALTISPMRDVANRISGASIIARDTSEHKRLHEELTQASRRYTEDLQHLTRAIQRAQEEERRRISRELHDDLNQRLSNLKLGIEVLVRKHPKNPRGLSKSLTEYAQQVDKMIRDVRTMASGLRPAILDDFGLIVSLQLLCRDFEKLHRCETTFSMCECTPNRFSADVQIAFYRVAQEAMANVAKHSAATCCDVKLQCDESLFKMIIQDNGKGFELTEVLSRETSRRGLGLTGMRERVEMMGGEFHIVSNPGKGTIMKAQIPLSICSESR